MEPCTFCQGPRDQATGICRRCGRISPDDPFDTAPVIVPPVSAESHCPRCGEETIAGQHFCRRCGLALPAVAHPPADQEMALPVGARSGRGSTVPDNTSASPTLPGSRGAWWESPTLPVINARGEDTPASARSLGHRVGFLILLLLVVGASTFGVYAVIHAQTQSHQVTKSGASPDGGAASTPTPAASPTPLPPVGTGYWHTNGALIEDEANQPVRIAGINWFGFESTTFVVHGLGQRDYHDLLRQVKTLGYNTIRIPFSDQLFFASSVPNGISFNNGMNQDLQGLNGLQILDKIVDAAGQLGLRIVLDHHGVDAGSQTELWSAPDCSVSCFEGTWQMLARHYLGNPTVIGADLDNEPHGAACWGCGDASVDWHREAEKVGNQILAINPHWLIFVEGTECYKGDCYWWGGNLEGVADYPVNLKVPHQVVYSPHDYPPEVYNLSYFSAPDFPDNLPGIWEAHWGFIARRNIAPLWLGEFGTQLSSTIDQQWLSSLISYLGTGARGISWAYWCLNPDSGDTGGILQNDWATVNQNKQDYLTPIEFPLGESATGNP
jgi:aryl-phospho-beta-D-glucosidase BglC (GH1 family)